MALIAGGLFVASLAVHAASLAGVDVRVAWPGVMWLHALVLGACFSLVLGPARRRHARSLEDALPRWGVRLVYVLFAYMIVNSVLFAIQSQGGGPHIRDGRYVLNSHGRVLQFLTEEEWHWYRALELRGASGHWVFCALLAALVWARRVRAQPGHELPAEPEQPLGERVLAAAERCASGLRRTDWTTVLRAALCYSTAVVAALGLGAAAALYTSSPRGDSYDEEALWSLLVGTVALVPSLRAANPREGGGPADRAGCPVLCRRGGRGRRSCGAGRVPLSAFPPRGR
jgi:hypothetical protein